MTDKNHILYQLPNGQWINPAHVVAVVALEGNLGATSDIPARVRVDYNRTHEIVNCESWDEALRVRDKIAADVNAALLTTHRSTE